MNEKITEEIKSEVLPSSGNDDGTVPESDLLDDTVSPSKEIISGKKIIDSPEELKEKKKKYEELKQEEESLFLKEEVPAGGSFIKKAFNYLFVEGVI